MANSKYEYVRAFEREDPLLPNTWIVVRIDGRGFHNHYNFTRPNDARALSLMNAAAMHVLRQLPDVVIAYGVSDEFSFVLHRATALFERRVSKLVSTVVSAYTAAYVWLWGRCMDVDGQHGMLDEAWLPTFDGRAVCYPSVGNLRDYLSWRQVDCHINNLYNTTFWTMVQKGGMSTTAAEEELKGTLAADKNEILWSRFGVNYNHEPEMFRKGSVVFREYQLEDLATKAGQSKGVKSDQDDDNDDNGSREPEVSKTQQEKIKKAKAKARITVEHLDIIKDEFWEKRPWLLSGKPGRPVVEGSS